MKNIDRFPTEEWISDASDLASAFQSSFSSIGNAASAMGIKTGNVFKKMDSTLSGSMQIMAGITTAMDATNPLAMPMGIMQGIGGVANIVGGLFSKDDKEEAKEARRARTFGTTINRGPTQYTIAPSLVIENGGDVYMGSEGIDAAAKTISNIVTEGLEYNGGPALQ